MKMYPIINKMATCVAVALVCIISGCGKKDASPPSTATPVADKPQSSTATPATPPAIAEPVAQKPVQLAEPIDLNSLIQRIPTNEFSMSPEGGWDKFTMPKVQKWIQSNLYGKRERINVCMIHCKVSQEDAATKPEEWTVNLKVTGIHNNYFGMANRILPIDKKDFRISYLDGTDENHSPLSIGLKDDASFSFNCTEAEARKFDALNKMPTPTVTIEGDIMGISFLPHLDASLGDFLGYDTFVQLENVVVTPSKDTEPGALYACEFMLPQGGLVVVPDEAVTEIKRLDNSGNYQLIFIKYNEWSSGKRNLTKLFSFSLANKLQGFYPEMKFVPCSNPPTESQITGAKAAVKWPSGQSLPQ